MCTNEIVSYTCGCKAAPAFYPCPKSQYGRACGRVRDGHYQLEMPCSSHSMFSQPRADAHSSALWPGRALAQNATHVPNPARGSSSLAASRPRANSRFYENFSTSSGTKAGSSMFHFGLEGSGAMKFNPQPSTPEWPHRTSKQRPSSHATQSHATPATNIARTNAVKRRRPSDNVLADSAWVPKTRGPEGAPAATEVHPEPAHRAKRRKITEVARVETAKIIEAGRAARRRVQAASSKRKWTGKARPPLASAPVDPVEYAKMQNVHVANLENCHMSLLQGKMTPEQLQRTAEWKSLSDEARQYLAADYVQRKRAGAFIPGTEAFRRRDMEIQMFLQRHWGREQTFHANCEAMRAATGSLEGRTLRDGGGAADLSWDDAPHKDRCVTM